ncbi:MAG: glycosyltransferase family 2 protein [Geminicoccaceae bacterium]
MLNREMGLSVVVSSYNYGRYLRAAIDSALAQNCDRLQVIVVDDGSTDDSIDIIRSYGDRVETLFQENQGQIKSCTAGLELCRHEIVIFLDSDDRLEPFAAEEIMALWTPGTVKVQYALQAIDSGGRRVNTVFPKYPHGLTPETIRGELLRAGVYPATTTSGTAFSRHFLQQVMPIPADYDCDIDDALNAVAPLHGDVQTLRKTLGQYRVHERNTSAHSELTAERFERYILDSQERARYLADSCKRLGYDLPDNVIENDHAYWESRLAAAVLKPDSRLGLLFPTLRAAFGSILDPGQRLMHAAWAVALTLAPRRFARHLLAQRFIFNRRSRFAEALLRNIWRFGRLTTPAAGGRNKERATADRCAAGSGGPTFAAAKGNDDAGI